MADIGDQSRSNQPLPSILHQSNTKDHQSRHSPVSPLVPLDVLQNHQHRRGSITDPSLHAANLNQYPNLNQKQPTILQPFRHTDLSSSDQRPPSNFVFGDATPHHQDNQQIRRLLHSPPTEEGGRARANSQGSHATNPRSLQGPSSEGNRPGTEPDKMMVDENARHEQQQSSPRQHFDYNMRRHSIAVGQDAGGGPLLGTKRKMSTDRGAFPPVGEEIDPQLAGPGVPSGMEMDAEAPAPKRRGSAIDTQRIANLSLYDRRNSVDSRAALQQQQQQQQQWWTNERRDAPGPAPLLPNPANMGAYNPGFAGSEQPHGRPPPGIATFAWPANHPPDHGPPPMPIPNENENTNMPAPPRQFDPATTTTNSNNAPLAMMPPMNFVPDRRMSVPNALTNPSPARALRSRSRPPSRMHSVSDASANPPPPELVGSSTAPENSDQAIASAGGSSTSSPSAPSKDKAGSTPYSRSPELRVSHKLAERKRRKEMKDLFDELRDQLPADRGMKASKWEILSKAIDFVVQLKQSHQDMAREIEMLRHELDAVRQGGLPPPFPPGGPPTHAVVYAQGPPPPGSGPYTTQPQPPGGIQQQQTPQQQQQQPLQHGPPSGSRPGSSHNSYNGQANAPPSQNGQLQRVEGQPS